MNKEEIKERAEGILESLNDLDNYDKFKVLSMAADKSVSVWENDE